MTAATITPVIPVTAAEVIGYGRALYRVVQAADWPEEGREALRRASSRLWTETEICKRVRDDGFTVTAGRIASARKAASDLIAAVHAYCGPQVIAAIGADEREVAA